MSKAVLVSIRPKWCEKIINGEKAVEVRKTRPKLQTPFKVYIYCTLQGMNEFFRAELGGDVARWNRDKWGVRKGAVIGEFTCDRIYRLVTSGPGGSYHVEGEDQGTTNLVARQSCLSLSDMHAYLQSKPGYGLHISGLKVYDAPKGLDAFRRACAHDWYCDSCAMHRENNGTCGNESLLLRRPPQSWCYVQEVE